MPSFRGFSGLCSFLVYFSRLFSVLSLFFSFLFSSFNLGFPVRGVQSVFRLF